MTAYPSGVVTFVFTDIEGSTRLAQSTGETFGDLMREHHQLITDTVSEHDGVIVSDTGDGLMAAFARAGDAVEACVAMQRELSAHRWPGGVDVRVRVGAHTGVAQPVEGTYRALAAHQAARVMDAGHGGQVVVSAETAAAAAPLPATIGAVPLGAFQLKDFDDPIELVEVAAHDHPRSFPPPRAPKAARVTEVDTSPLYGRDDDLERIATALVPGAIVTLVGPAGVGKTRLAMRAASQGALWPAVKTIHLAEVEGEAAVIPSVARELGARAAPGQDLLDACAGVVSRQGHLLVVDNAEHVLAATRDVVERLAASCPDSAILVTSRSRLGLEAESVIEVAPLSVPAPTATLAELKDNPAVALIVDRGRRIGISLDTSEEDLRSVAAVAAAVEGLPLALELAAARTGLLAPEEIVDSLLGDRRGEPRDSLTGALQWSFDLCRPAERLLLARLSCFAARVTLATATEVLADTEAGGLDASEIPDALSGLIAKSLLTATTDSTPRRFGVLRAVRSFAADRLDWDDGLALRGRQREWAAGRLTRAVGEPYEALAKRVRADYANLLDITQLAVDAAPSVAAELALRLYPFWLASGDLASGERIFESLLRGPLSRRTTGQVRNALAFTLMHRGEFVRARDLARLALPTAAGDRAEEVRFAYTLFRAELSLGELPAVPEGMAEAAADPALPPGARSAALQVLATHARATNDLDAMLGYADAARQVHLDNGDYVAAALQLQTRGHAKFFDPDKSGVLADYQQSLQELQAHGGGVAHIAMAKGMIGSVLANAGDHEGARVLLAQSVEGCRAAGIDASQSLSYLAVAQIQLGRLDEARDNIDEVLRDARRGQHPQLLIDPLRVRAELAVMAGNIEEAVNFADEALAIVSGAGTDPWQRGHAHRLRGALHRIQGEPDSALRHLRLAFAEAQDGSPAHDIGALGFEIGLFTEAAQLFGAEVARGEDGVIYSDLRQRERDELRAVMGARAFDEELARGRAMTDEELVATIERVLVVLEGAIGQPVTA